MEDREEHLPSQNDDIEISKIAAINQVDEIEADKNVESVDLVNQVKDAAAAEVSMSMENNDSKLEIEKDESQKDESQKDEGEKDESEKDESDGDISVQSKNSENESDIDHLEKGNDQGAGADDDNDEEKLEEDDVDIIPSMKFFYNFLSSSEFGDTYNDHTIWTLKSLKEYLKSLFDTYLESVKPFEAQNESNRKYAAKLYLMFRDLNAIVGTCLLYGKELDLSRDSDKEADDMSELNIHNLKLHFVAFRDIPLSTFTDLQALLSEEEKSCTTFDPLTTKFLPLSSSAALAELEAALEACKEESFDEVDSALRELQDVEASFAQMMQSDRDGEGVEKSTKPEGALDSQAEGKVADEGGSISEAKEGANGDKSISEEVPLKRSRVPFDITNMTYDEYCSRHYSYHIELYQKNKGRVIAPPPPGPAGQVSQSQAPQPQAMMINQQQQQQQQQQQMHQQPPMAPVMSMGGLGLGTYYPNQGGYGGPMPPMGMPMMGMQMGMPMGPMGMQMGMPMGMPMGMGMPPMGMQMMSQAGHYGMNRGMGGGRGRGR